MTKVTVFTLQEQDVTVKKAGGNVTAHMQHRIIYFCIIYASGWCSTKLPPPQLQQLRSITNFVFYTELWPSKLWTSTPHCRNVCSSSSV